MGDPGREDDRRPELARRVFNLTPPPTPEFSRLGQDPTPNEFGHQMVRFLPLHTNFLEANGAGGGQHNNACQGWQGGWSRPGSGGQVSGPGAGQRMGRPEWESQSARFSVLVTREGQTLFPNFSKGRGYSGAGGKGKKSC